MPTYDLSCPGCGSRWERISTIADRYAPCEVCGTTPEQEFRHSVQHHPFVAYFDIGLGIQVNSLGDRKRAMRQQKMDYRDLPSKGELSARRDRLEQARRPQGRE